MSLRRAAVLMPLLASLACDSSPPAAKAPADAELPRAAPNVLYAIGAAMADQVKDYHLDETEVRELARGLTDGALGKASADVRSDQVGAKVNEFHEARMKELARREELAGAFLLEQAAREPGAMKTEGGAILKVIETGSGAKPKFYDFVNVNYQGKLRDGSVFLSNEGKPPERSKLGMSTRCWQEALGAVSAGSRIQLVCPPALSYGWGGWPDVVPGGAVLSYDLELVSVEPQEPPSNWQPDWDISPKDPVPVSK
jgi:FKBP-type peptidyl-prolyl cis-trans isomerase FkpA